VFARRNYYLITTKEDATKDLCIIRPRNSENERQIRLLLVPGSRFPEVDHSDSIITTSRKKKRPVKPKLDSGGGCYRKYMKSVTIIISSEAAPRHCLLGWLVGWLVACLHVLGGARARLFVLPPPPPPNTGGHALLLDRV